MARALRLAARGRGAAHPNPRVGCVLADSSGGVIATGWHRRHGGPHAERMALDAAGPAARGSACYVTLEPCAHHGHTPPCAEALVAAGVRRVVAAMEDPDARVSGRGLALLRDAGVEVETGLMEEAAAALNPGYIRRKGGGRPWLRCKLAVSVDGRTALANGSSRWISSPAARQDAHRTLRAESAAIMTGIGTVLADDPRLDIRHARPLPEPPLRVVLDRKLRIGPEPRLLHCPGRIMVFCCGDKLPPHAAALPPRLEAVALPVPPDKLPEAALDYLGREMEINEVLLEAGPRLSGACLAAGLVDELVVYMGASILGDSAKGMFSLPELKDIDAATRMRFASCKALPDRSGMKLVMRRR